MKPDMLIAIVSRKELEPKELAYLFLNIKTIYLRPALNISLDEVVMNPYNYIGRDILISRIKEQAVEVKAIAIENIEKILLRGEKLERLLEKTDDLARDTISFKREAKRLNSCCRF